MITRLEITRYRCFDQVDVELGDFRVIIGANGSGKTTLLDVPVLLGDMLRERNIGDSFTQRRNKHAPRATSFSELIFQGKGDTFILTIEVKLPDEIVKQMNESKMRVQTKKRPDLTHLRYELRLQNFNNVELQVQNEYLFAFNSSNPPDRPKGDKKASRLQGEVNLKREWRSILSREYGKESEYKSETVVRPKVKRAHVARQQLALPSVQFESVEDFPAAKWLFDFLVEEAVFFSPDWNQLRMACPPGMPSQLISTGHNAPWLALNLKKSDPDRYDLWKHHVSLALPQISDITVHEREDDHHAYFRVRYCDKYEVPSSGLSDGTLHILVLTLLAYLPKLPSFLVTEEPENGIHPKAIEMVLQSLSSIYDSQVIVSSHSPVVVANTELSRLLTSQVQTDGSVEIIAGQDHPRLAGWKREIDIATLFAAGVLG